MKNLFNSIQIRKPKSNSFDLTHDVKMTGRMGNLMPVLTMPVFPGDKVTIGADMLIRFAPLVSPVMHRMDATIHYFFCPNRILWPNWEKFIVNEATGGIPTLSMDSARTAAQKTFLDYFGIPPYTAASGDTTPIPFNALPIAAYQKIYNEYYRDQNLITEVIDTLVDGNNAANIVSLLTMRKRAYEHDYFTSALPFAQKGSAVDIPLGVVELNPAWESLAGTPRFVDGTLADVAGDITQNGSVPGEIESGGTGPMAYDPEGTLNVGATTITDLRRAFKLQEWLEKNARGGTRYIENILMHFGIKSSDKRLQRPEYITGTKSPVIISEVLNTTGSTGELPQGNMSGHAISVGDGYTGQYFCEEHGYIIGIMSVMPKPSYAQGMPKDFMKTDPLDFPWPSFANIGEQAIDQNEIFAYREPVAYPSATVFGYTPRYAEYKFMQNRVAGEFRNTLSFWTMWRKFASTPLLNQEFIEVDASDSQNEDIFAVQDTTDNLMINVLNKIRARRALPVFGTPML